MRGVLLIATAALVAVMTFAAPAAAEALRSGPVYAEAKGDSVVLGNGLVERRWSRSGFQTTELQDRRGEGRVWSRDRRDFTLWIGGAQVGSETLDVGQVRLQKLANDGIRVEMDAAPPGGVPYTATRIAEAYPGIAGLRMQTVLRSTVPMTLAGATLDEAAAGRAVPSLHAFRAGGDWRDPEWTGPQFTFGDAHPGDWRDTKTAPAGQPLDGPGQWLSLADGNRSLFMVMERNDLPSSRGSYDGSVGDLRVNYQRDIIDLGPLEEQGHAESQTENGGRQRAITPGQPFALEPTFTGVGRGDGDEAWQFHRYLEGPRSARYRHDVVFNSNGTDTNRISTGAKDDMDLDTVKAVAPIARRLGIETFVLDDGWQAASGDWEPDSPQHPEPRWDGSPTSKFKPRFPDDEFRAVRDAIAPMRLGLWMSPMSFNPQSQTYKSHPDWACSPTGQATAADTAADPDSGSNEAGIGLWSPAAIPHIEGRIRDAIDNWGVTYFKFDFLVWLDCSGEGTLHDYHDKFVAMIDRLRHDHPDVTFQIDETNDYRMFPFESVSRAPTWFQNGTPPPDRLLHALWNLSPFVPGYALGQHFLGGQQWKDFPVDTLMAVALLSHMTFFSELRSVPANVIDEAAPWIDFYKTHRDLFGGVVYPLLDDPLGKGWTALQSWDPEAGRGALLTFRQDSGDATRMVALRNVPPGMTFDLMKAPDLTPVRRVSSEDLTRGIEVSLPQKNAAEVLAIEPVRPPQTDSSGGSSGAASGGGAGGGGPAGQFGAPRKFGGVQPEESFARCRPHFRRVRRSHRARSTGGRRRFVGSCHRATRRR